MPSTRRQQQLLAIAPIASCMLFAGCGTDAPEADASVDEAAQTLTTGASIPVNVRANTIINRVYGPALDESVVVQSVRKSLLTGSGVSYRAANVFDGPASDTYASTHSFIVHLLEKDVYLFETVLLVLDNQGQVQSVTRNYAEQPTATYASPSCPDPTVTAVFGTNCATGGACGQINTAVAAVDAACAAATAAGLTCRTLKGAAATVEAYRNWMACSGLVAFGNVGHGSTTGIALENGSLNSTWFSASKQEGLISDTVTFFNSCQVHNAPLQPAIVGNADARTFIGGIPNLLIGPSENVFKCFWNAEFGGDASIESTLRTCESSNYPSVGAFGISGRANGASLRTTDLLWGHTDGTASLWTVNSANQLIDYRAHGPFAGWTPANYSDGKVLWKHVDGHISLWTVDAAGNYVSSVEHGPFEGWSAVNYADRKILWKHVSGQISLWTVDAAGNWERNIEHGPYDGWSAVNYSDGKILWKYLDERISLWTVDGDGNLETYVENGPYEGWSAANYANNKVLWKHVDGHISLWTVDDVGNLSSYIEHGPYAGWSAANYANNKILWKQTDGQVSLWSVDGAGNLQGSQAHGPYAGWSALDSAR